MELELSTTNKISTARAEPELKFCNLPALKDFEKGDNSCSLQAEPATNAAVAATIQPAAINLFFNRILGLHYVPNLSIRAARVETCFGAP